jgi:cytochrome c556
MVLLRKSIGALLGAAAVAWTMGASMVAHADDKDVIDYREHIMKSLDEQTAELGMIVSTLAPPDQLRSHCDALALIAKTVAKSFEAKVPGGEAKPEVWAKWDDFSARIKTFVEKSQAMADAADKGASVTQITELLVDALPCKGCHDVYREEKKP